MNPYDNQDFFGFWKVLFLGLFESRPWASDELQLAALVLLALGCVTVGLFLFLEKRTMIANSLSHTILLGIVVGYLVWQFLGYANEPTLPFMMGASFITALSTLFIIEFLEEKLGLDRTLANGFVFTTLFALGIVLVTLYTRSAHLGLETVMGDLDLVGMEEVTILLFTFLFNFTLFMLFRRELTLIAFEPAFAKRMGIWVGFFRWLTMGMTAAACVASFRVAGVIMPLAFFTAPVVFGRLFCHRIKTIYIAASFMALLSAATSVALSRHLLSVEGIALSTAGLSVTLLFILFLAALALFSIRKRI